MDEMHPRILIVDDVPENLYIVENLLHSQGYETVSAGNGVDALREAEQQDFDLVLLDVLMPKMDGFEVCARLRLLERAKEVPVIFLTALTDDENILSGFEVGGVDYVTKPFRPAELVARVETQLALRRRALELASLNASKDKFISIIANELRQPFAALRGVLRMLTEEYGELSDEDRREYIEMSYHSCDNLYRLASGLMTWSSLQRGVLLFRPVVVNLLSAVEDALAGLESGIETRQLKVQVEIPADADAQADREMLDSILFALLSNAVMYNTDQGSLRVLAAPSDEFWEIAVVDTGIGIDELDQKRLFRIDENLRGRGTYGESGTGMGLILANELVERHGGRLQLSSSEGETRVSFTIPRMLV